MSRVRRYAADSSDDGQLLDRVVLGRIRRLEVHPHGSCESSMRADPPWNAVLEIGCIPGAAARQIARRIGDGHVLGVDRSAKAITPARAGQRAGGPARSDRHPSTVARIAHLTGRGASVMFVALVL